jgi:hypothetical protein
MIFARVLALEIWPNIYLSPLFSAMFGDIDLIFGMWVYNDKLQIKFTFHSGPMILVKLWPLDFEIWPNI